MKRFLFFLFISAYLFACNSGDDSKSETTVTDSSSASMQQQTSNCAPGDSSQMGYWQIDTATAGPMIRNLAGNGSGNNTGIRYRRDNVVQMIKDSFKTNFMGFIPARYTAADVERYRSKRCIGPADSAGMVTQYFTNLIKVRVPNNGAGSADPVFVYFDLVTICPPPEDGSCPPTALETKSGK